MKSLARTIASLALVLLACKAEPLPDSKADTSGKTEKPEAPLPEVSTANPEADPVPKPMPPQDGFFMAEGAPSPRACTVASDCMGNTIPVLDNPCCQDPLTLEPYARAYWEWLGRWRMDNCAAVECPPPPPPSLPPECAFKPDCVDGTCVDTCD